MPNPLKLSDEPDSRIIYLDDVPPLPLEANSTLEKLVADMSRQLAGVYDQCLAMNLKNGVTSEVELLTISHAFAQFRSGYRDLLLRCLTVEGEGGKPE